MFFCVQKQHLKNWVSSGSGTLKLAVFFGTWGFSKPAVDEVLFSDILVVKGTVPGGDMTRKIEGMPSDSPWIHM